ncbi:glycosyltransferase family 2 protein [Paraburkholderia hospita]|uniref:glycosyltransferase family 2 protein n=1 Tax=Paraburkholderia hospita TaxID=169430 RepID=UPI000B34A0C3|nr:glycosyltransferase family 2 protein [Paraburkholderia hospita]OUL82345.1 glycosyltransferase [Paraburkholderia hospita]
MTAITKASGPEISVVIPSYNCLGCLEELCVRLDRVLAELVPSFEVVIVDDRSPDNSWPLITALSKRFPAVRGIRLSRNFGQHIAITAGIAATLGKYVVVMDCDLQDPPERIPDLYRRVQEGFDLVLARRVERTHSRFRVLAAKAYFASMTWLTGEFLDGSYGTFSILSRQVADAFLQFTERDRHYLFILRWLGFNSSTIEYGHEARHAGSSSYTFRKLVKHAIDGMFFQTSVFLNWIVYGGLVCTAASLMLGLFFIYRYWVASTLPGWTSLVVVVLFSTGLILASIGAVGMYVSRMFEASKGRPLYLIDRECSCDDDHETQMARFDEEPASQRI